MPDTKFLGVLGAYGDQILPPTPLPNMEIIDHVSGHDMSERVYARSRVVCHAGIFADRDDLGSWLSVLTAVLEPDAWQQASARDLVRSAELDPAADLKTWAEAIDHLAR
ncbi:hypothetical protein ACWEKM_39450 [Streptomyces sp. NPDC004752]